jgi:anti-sigma factor RsiW
MLCGRVTNLLSAYIDRELAGAEMLQVREHLSRCEGCRAEHADLLEMKSLLGGMPAPPPRSDHVRATVARLHAAQGVAPTRRPPFWAGWSFLSGLPLGQSLRVGALATCLVLALVATGAALRQPVTADAVVAGLSRSGIEEWQVRPWEGNAGRQSAWRALWNGAFPPAVAPVEHWFFLARPADGTQDSAVGLVREIAHRQPVGLSWALD